MSLIEELIIFKLENLSEAEKLSDKTSELVDLAYNLGHVELASMIEDNYY
jgi:hypothetical protein